MKTIYICIIVLGMIPILVFGQVGIGTDTPASSAMLDVTSTTMGLLVPRMNSAQRIAISSPTEGLLVYDTDIGAFYY
jgi:hypothetical protein